MSGLLTVFSIKILKIFEVCCNSLIDEREKWCSIKTVEKKPLKNEPKKSIKLLECCFCTLGALLHNKDKTIYAWKPHYFFPHLIFALINGQKCYCTHLRTQLFLMVRFQWSDESVKFDPFLLCYPKWAIFHSFTVFWHDRSSCRYILVVQKGLKLAKKCG